ncbi:hypothetical protein [Bellilinea caldifistulae]|uniref:hypothetical protein n=1 Tax=Bellilinea caldifistulae TaxID=360411 RepID=UPI0014704980|nr:hypothetical protein [Bellilinea caldifistulae]
MSLVVKNPEKMEVKRSNQDTQPLYFRVDTPSGAAFPPLKQPARRITLDFSTLSF